MAYKIQFVGGEIIVSQEYDPGRPDDQISTSVPVGTHGPLCGGSMYFMPIAHLRYALVCKKCFYRAELHGGVPTVGALPRELDRLSRI